MEPRLTCVTCTFLSFPGCEKRSLHIPPLYRTLHLNINKYLLIAGA